MRRDPVYRWLVVASTVLLLAGLTTGLATVCTWFVRVHEVHTSQAALARSGGPADRLYLPRLHLTFVVVEGAGERDLLRGPGHIPGTAGFGQPGNAGVAGHRYPGVFWDLDRLRVGDPVVVETPDSWYVYRVTAGMVVGAQDTQVLDAHPAGAAPTAQAFLTLVTCDPKLTTAHRLIRQAELVRTEPQAGDRPAELG